MERDAFTADEALAGVLTFQGMVYRVNAYNVSTGLYTVLTDRGAAPYTLNIDMAGTGSAAGSTMADVLDELKSVDEQLANSYDGKRLQALWSNEAKTLYLVYSDERHEQRYKNTTIDRSWFDDDVRSHAWTGYYIRDLIEKVDIDASVADVKFYSMKKWFNRCKALTTITGLKNLNTAEATDMSWMFYGCEALTQLDLRPLKTDRVTTMDRMFEGCKALTRLYLNNFDTRNVTSMASMFADCAKLSDLGLDKEKFNTAKVTNMNYMFSNCAALTKLDLRWLRSDALGATMHMFDGCGSLGSLYRLQHHGHVCRMPVAEAALHRRVRPDHRRRPVCRHVHQRARLGVGQHQLRPR